LKRPSLEAGVYRISFGKKMKRNANGIFAFALCHEIVHLLGSEPRKTTSTWVSTEAQSTFVFLLMFGNT